MTYNVFSGTLNPTHFTSPVFSVQLETVLRTVHFSGPGRSLGALCVCPDNNFRTKMPFDLDTWQAGSSRSLGNVRRSKFKSQERKQELSIVINCCDGRRWLKSRPELETANK